MFKALNWMVFDNEPLVSMPSQKRYIFAQMMFDHLCFLHDLDLRPSDLKIQLPYFCPQMHLICESGEIPTRGLQDMPPKVLMWPYLVAS